MISRMRGNECESVGVEFKKVKKKIYMLCGMCGGAVGNIFFKEKFFELVLHNPRNQLANWNNGRVECPPIAPDNRASEWSINFLF